MPTVEIVDETSRFPHGDALQHVVTELMQGSGLADNEITIVLLDDATIAELNERDRGVAGPTDVLSYPTHEPTDVGFPELAHLGDVLISLDTAATQARAVGHSLALEVATLAAHGLTHLRGLDHQEPADWTAFDAAQEQARALMARALQAEEGP
jgi:probable rRNA maturation factor